MSVSRRLAIPSGCCHPGVYVIRNTFSGDCYVGQSVNILQRWGSHLVALSSKKHYNVPLQCAWDQDGADAFVFEVLEVVVVGDGSLSELLAKRERWWIRKLKPAYNVLLPRTVRTVPDVVALEKRRAWQKERYHRRRRQEAIESIARYAECADSI